MSKTDSKYSSEKESYSAPQNIQLKVPYAQQFEEDTIDLYELWITLWNKKWFIVAFTVLAAFGSAVYALKQPNVYKVEAVLLRPSLKNVQALNLKHNIREVSRMGDIFAELPIRTEVFTSFKKNLSSRNLQKKFIEKHDLLNVLAPGRTPGTKDIEIFQNFSNMIRIEPIQDGFDFDDGFLVTMESTEPEFAAKLVNDYVSFFDLETIRGLVEAMQNSIGSQIREIENTIKSKRKMALIRRQDQIKRYEEAAKIASSLGAKERIEATNVVQNNQRQAVVEMQGTLTPLYYLGSKAIEAEILTLKSRNSDDPFIIGLRDLEEKLSLLHSIAKVDHEGLKAVFIDRAAFPPKNRIKPNRRLITVCGTALGFFLGIFLVLIISYLQKQKEFHFQ